MAGLEMSSEIGTRDSVNSGEMLVADSSAHINDMTACLWPDPSTNHVLSTIQLGAGGG